MAGLWVGYRTRSEGRRTNFHTLVVANIRKRAQSIARRVPAKLDPTLMKEPRVIQGVPRIPMSKARRKPIPSMLGPNGPLS